MKKILAQVTSNAFLKSSVIMFTGNMVTNVLAYLYHLVIGRMLGPSGYGELAALISILYILNTPVLVIQNVLVKFFATLKARKAHGQSKRLFMIVLKWMSIALVVGFVLVVPFTSMVASFLHIQDSINLVFLYLIFASFVVSIINVSVLLAFQRFVALTIANNVGGVLRLIFGVLAAGFGVTWTVFANLLTGIVTYVIYFIPLKDFLRHAPKPVSLSAKSAVLYSVPTLITMMAVGSLYSQDVVLVKHYFSAVDAGLYSSLSVLGKIIFFASSSLGAVAFPMLAERKELGKPTTGIIAASLGAVAVLSFGVTAFYYFFPEFVVTMLFGNAFVQASGYLASFGLFITFFTLSNLLANMYLALGKTIIWVAALTAGVAQIVLIGKFHTSLTQVITVNTWITAGLFFALLLYYPYATRRS